MTYAAALTAERWPAGGARVLTPRTRLEVEAGMRAEDSWLVARERPVGRVDPDYGDRDQVEDQRTLAMGREADRGGYVPRDDRVPASLWDYVRRYWVNLKDLAWELKMSPSQRNDLGRSG